MALGVALAGLVFENIGRFAGNRIQFEIVAVFDFITYEFETGLGNSRLITQPLRKRFCFSEDIRMLPVNEIRRCQILFLIPVKKPF
ncbi:MAG: hypothetical protein AB2687_06975 [Candidatus Thiodiazotropha taylori]